MSKKHAERQAKKRVESYAEEVFDALMSAGDRAVGAKEFAAAIAAYSNCIHIATYLDQRSAAVQDQRGGFGMGVTPGYPNIGIGPE